MTTIKELVDKAYILKARAAKLDMERRAIEKELKEMAAKSGETLVVAGEIAKATIAPSRVVDCHLKQGHLPHLVKILGPAFKSHVKVTIKTGIKSVQEMPQIFGRYCEVKDGPISIRYKSLR